MPLSVNFPTTSYLSPPRPLIADEAKWATGNFAMSNHSGRLISVSDSSLARSMLPSSMSKSAFDRPRSLGTNTMLAFQRRNRPSTLPPICFDMNRISLLSMSTPCAPAWPAARSIIPSEGINERNRIMLSPSLREPQAISEVPGSRQRLGQHRVAIGKRVPQSRRDMDTDQRQQGEVQHKVHAPRQSGRVMGAGIMLKPPLSTLRDPQRTL